MTKGRDVSMTVLEETLERAIRKKCLECSGNSRKEVENCAFKDCTLWPYRMWMRQGRPSEGAEQIEMVFDIVKDTI